MMQIIPGIRPSSGTKLPEKSRVPLSHSQVTSGGCTNAILPNVNVSRGCPEILPLALKQAGQSLGGPLGLSTPDQHHMCPAVLMR